jgi:hypothetical protein
MHHFGKATRVGNAMRMTYNFGDMTVHVVQECVPKVRTSVEYHGDVMVVTLRDMDSQSEEITSVEHKILPDDRALPKASPLSGTKLKP